LKPRRRLAPRKGEREIPSFESLVNRPNERGEEKGKAQYQRPRSVGKKKGGTGNSLLAVCRRRKGKGPFPSKLLDARGKEKGLGENPLYLHRRGEKENLVCWGGGERELSIEELLLNKLEKKHPPKSEN